MVLNSSKAVPSSIAIQGTMKDIMGGKKRWRWNPQWAAIVADRNDDDNN
jgi:hypothetical protein